MGQLDVDVIGMVMGCWWIDGGLPILGLPLPLPLPLQRGRLPHPDRAPLRSVRAPFSGSWEWAPEPRAVRSRPQEALVQVQRQGPRGSGVLEIFT